MEPLLLASSSPRRNHILRNLGISFVVYAPDIDESRRDYLPPALRVVALAEDKARAAARTAGDAAPSLVLAADTLVCIRLNSREPRSARYASYLDDEEIVLGKPLDREDARRMIRLLAGQVHVVHTGLAVLDRRTDRVHLIRSDSLVAFSPMNDEEIDAYLGLDEWKGVAGAYRIQGWAALFIEEIDGSWSGIMGLPIHELYDILAQAGCRLRPYELKESSP